MEHSKLGVIIIKDKASDQLANCLSALAHVPSSRLRILIADTQPTPPSVCDFTNAPLGLRFEVLHHPDIQTPAASAARGLDILLKDKALSHFWIIGASCTPTLKGIAALLRFLDEGLGEGMTGGRLIDHENPYFIASDGAYLSPKTGTARHIQRGLWAESCPSPDDTQLAFIPLLNVVVSRAFVLRYGGPDKHLYAPIAEANWASKNRLLPISFCPGFDVFVRSRDLQGAKSKASLSYAMHRQRMSHVRATQNRIPFAAYLSGLAATFEAFSTGRFALGAAIMRGTFGRRPTEKDRRLLPAQLIADFDRIDYKRSTPPNSVRAAGTLAKLGVNQTTRCPSPTRDKASSTRA